MNVQFWLQSGLLRILLSLVQFMMCLRHGAPYYTRFRRFRAALLACRGTNRLRSSCGVMSKCNMCNFSLLLGQQYADPLLCA
jgi:hypothetical protein